MCSLLLSCFFTFGRKIVFSGSVFSGWQENYFKDFNAFDLVLFLLAALFIYAVLLTLIYFAPALRRLVTTNRPRKASPVKIALSFSLGLMLLWSPYFLSFFPGFVLSDSLSSIRQALWGISSNQHPAVYTLFVKVFITVGRHLGSLSSLNTGVFLYALFQYVVMALVQGGLLSLLYSKNVRLVYVLAAGLFFGIMPVFPSYALILWKDPLFSVGLLLLSIYLYFFVDQPQDRNKKWMWLLLIVGSFLTLFFRNNGVYTFAAVLLLFAIVIKKPSRAASFFMAGMIALYFFISGPVLSYFKVEKPSVEAYGVPIQQVAYVAAQSPGELTGQEAAVIGAIVPLEQYSAIYDPCLVDSIKFSSSFDRAYWNQHSGDFLRTYLSMLPKHFPAYVKAYCLATFGFWHPCLQNEYGYIDQFITENTLEIHTVDLIQNVFGFSVQDKLLAFRPMLGSGTLAWIMLVSLTLCLESGQKKRALFYAPPFFLWLFVLIATPVAFSFRYVYFLALLLPMMLIYPFLSIPAGRHAEQKEEKEA